MPDARILTWNTQLRSWGMEAGFPPSLPPVDTAEERATIMAQLLRSSDYDIVCLNEVFDEDAREILSDGLRNEFPYQVAKADLIASRIVRPGFWNDINNKVFELVFGPLADTAALVQLKFEDSGLFVASRWPFDTSFVPQVVIDAMGADVAAAVFPDGLLTYSFNTYGDCTSDDCRAAKGVLHVRFRRSPTVAYDIFATHTQADTDAAGENAGERGDQLREAWDFIQSRTGGPPFTNPTLYLGDMNVLGGLADDAVAPDEWREHFDTSGQPFTDFMPDQWGAVQCRGGSTGLDDRGLTADVRYLPLRQRLDIIAAALPNHVTQHVRVEHDLNVPPVGIPGVSYMSDHRPLSIHLADPHPNASPPTAFQVSPIDFGDARGMQPGWATWYRYDLQGTYEFRVVSDDDGVDFEIYLGSDLSRPRKPYRNEVDPERGTRFVLVAPFFVKVHNRFRDREFSYDYFSHRHVGRSPDDAIHLIPGVPYVEAFPNLQQLNGDESRTPWPDQDTKWFRFDTPRVKVGRAIRVGALLDDLSAQVLLELLVARLETPPPYSFVDQTGAFSTGSRGLQWDAQPDDTFFVCVTRRDPGFRGIQFRVMAETDLSLLRGGVVGNATLFCEEETSGWGADDIELELQADGGTWSQSINNDMIGDFEQDAMRQIGQWIQEIVPYQDGIAVTVKELDDIGQDDIGHGTIPTVEKLVDTDRWTTIGIDKTGTVEGALAIDVDDGTYSLRCSIRRWDETV